MVGAGFAGLACAKRAAELGLSVVVVERQSKPGRHIHTTGILVREAWELWPVPDHLVRRLRTVRVYSPGLRSVDLRGDDYFFMATDTAGLLAHLAEEAAGAGAEIRFGTSFEAAGLTCRYLVGADGARSGVAEHFGLSRNRHFLAGVEWEFEPSPDDGDRIHCFVTPDHAPGYIGWFVPGVEAAQVGLAVRGNRKPNLRSFVSQVDGLFGISDRRVLERRGGLIPVGGPLRNVFTDRVLLTGDAAGLVSPLTAGGIHTAYRFGKLAGEAVADYLRGGPDPGPRVVSCHPSFGWKRAMRWAWDHLPVAQALDGGLLGRAVFKRAAEAVFFDR